MGDPVLTLIVVTHNSARWLPGFFESWAKCGTMLPTEVVVADSGSTDNSLMLAAELHQDARLLECGNIGYGAAVNRAVAGSSAPWILICNPDLTFPEDFLEKWSFTLYPDAPEERAFAPALINPNGSPQSSTGNFPTIGNLIADQFRTRMNRKSIALNKLQMREVPWATGACLLLPRNIFRIVGGFDEKFFLYAEEVDLQRRLSNIHCHTMLCSEIEVTHHSPCALRPPDRKLKRYAARGLLRYFAKHGSALQLFTFRLLAFFSFRLTPGEAFASRKKILERATGP